MRYLLFKQPEQDTGIEAVSRSDGADNLYRMTIKGFSYRAGKQVDRATPLRVDKVGTVKFDFVSVYACGIREVEQILEIFGRPFYDIGIFEVFQCRRDDFHRLVCMGFPEVRVVVDDGFSVFGIF